jgi:long-chain-fatty-acid--CoA ligase ACSBG
MTNRGLKRSIANWAKSIGVEQTYNEAIKRETSFGFKVAKFLVYDNVKKALGLDQVQFLII